MKKATRFVRNARFKKLCAEISGAKIANRDIAFRQSLTQKRLSGLEVLLSFRGVCLYGTGTPILGFRVGPFEVFASRMLRFCNSHML
jgi:hypothetical protein